MKFTLLPSPIRGIILFCDDNSHWTKVTKIFVIQDCLILWPRSGLLAKSIHTDFLCEKVKTSRAIVTPGTMQKESAQSD